MPIYEMTVDEMPVEKGHTMPLYEISVGKMTVHEMSVKKGTTCHYTKCL